MIATCCGQNKKESKALVAKLALSKVAPNVYQGMFADEAPPDDQTLTEKKEVLIPANQLTLNDR